MKKILFCLVLILTINSNLSANTISLQNYKELVEMTLHDLIVDVLTNSNKSFIIDKNIDVDLLIFYKPEEPKNINFLKKILISNGYELTLSNDVYFIKKIEILTDIPKEEKLYLKSIDLKYLNFSDIENILKLQKVDYSYLKNVNRIFLNCSDEKFNEVKQFINNIDVLPRQQKIKISIIETNLGKLKNYETLINANFNNSQKLVFDFLLGSPLNINNKANYDNVDSVLKFLNSNNISKSIIDTVVNLENNEEFKLISSQNIPFLTTSNTLSELTVNEVNRYDYKDVGLNLKINPIITDDLLNINLNFSYSQLLDSNADKPITTKKELNQKFSINKENKRFIISGINNFSKSSKTESIPFLSDIPLLGLLFTNEYINESFTTTTILIEFVNEFDNLKKENKSNSIEEKANFGEAATTFAALQNEP
ncbi:MAG: hypothetical protein PHD79_10250 [Aliarcobacter sp.]|nr:hypothetical protein [Aliarcobacter sp.]